MLFAGRNMERIALTFTTVNVGSLKKNTSKAGTSITRGGGAEVERKISHSDKSEVLAGGQRCQALSKGALAFVP